MNLDLMAIDAYSVNEMNGAKVSRVPPVTTKIKTISNHNQNAIKVVGTVKKVAGVKDSFETLKEEIEPTKRKVSAWSKLKEIFKRDKTVHQVPKEVGLPIILDVGEFELHSTFEDIALKYSH